MPSKATEKVMYTAWHEHGPLALVQHCGHGGVVADVLSKATDEVVYTAAT